MYEILDAVTGQVVYPGFEEVIDTKYALDHIQILPDNSPGGTDTVVFNLRPQRCTCWPTDPAMHTVIAGHTEPGSTMEHNPDCEVHHAR